MKYVRISNNCGLKVSVLSLGTWHLPRLPEKDDVGAYKIDVDEFKKVLKKAFDAGINFIDTANRYHGGISPVPLSHAGYAERLLGKLIKELNLPREELVIATKVGAQMSSGPNGSGLSRKHIVWQVKESLSRLQLEYVDIYYAHVFDPETPKLETLRTFNDLVRRGLTLYLGLSNIPPHHLVDYLRISEIEGLEPVVVLQYKYNLMERDAEKDVIPIAKEFKLGITAYSPLAQGFLTGKYVDIQSRKWVIPDLSRATYMTQMSKRYFTDENLKFMIDFVEYAKSMNVTPTQLALAWLLKMSEIHNVPIIPIIGVSKINHLEEALVATEINLKDNDLKYLNEISLKIGVSPQ